jgi:hypothetical protein
MQREQNRIVREQIAQWSVTGSFTSVIDCGQSEGNGKQRAD